MSPIFCVKIALSNSGTMCPRWANPSSPPLSLLPGSSEYFLASSAKFPPALQLLQNAFGLGLGRRVGLGVGARRHADENVPRARLFRHRILRLVRVVVLLNLLLRGLRHSARHIVGRKGEVGDFALFRNRARVARRVFLEEASRSLSDGLICLAQIVARDHRVIELDLDVLLAIVRRALPCRSPSRRR